MAASNETVFVADQKTETKARVAFVGTHPLSLCSPSTSLTAPRSLFSWFRLSPGAPRSRPTHTMFYTWLSFSSCRRRSSCHHCGAWRGTSVASRGPRPCWCRVAATRTGAHAGSCCALTCVLLPRQCCTCGPSELVLRACLARLCSRRLLTMLSSPVGQPPCRGFGGLASCHGGFRISARSRVN